MVPEGDQDLLICAANVNTLYNALILTGDMDRLRRSFSQSGRNNLTSNFVFIRTARNSAITLCPGTCPGMWLSSEKLESFTPFKFLRS